MAQYPLVAELIYKDKHLNVTIPLRAQKIKFVKYKCPNCMNNGTKNDVCKYYRRHKKEGVVSHYKGRSKIEIPDDLTEEFGDELYCPLCLLEKKEKNVMIKTEKDVYKVYVPSMINTYIKVGWLLHKYFSFRWKEGGWFKQEDTPSAYCDTLKDMYRGLNHYLNLNIPKDGSVKVKVYKVKKKVFDDSYQKYLDKKFVREL